MGTAHVGLQTIQEAVEGLEARHTVTHTDRPCESEQTVVGSNGLNVILPLLQHCHQTQVMGIDSSMQRVE